MLAEIISFGGYVGRKYERRKPVRLVPDVGEKITVKVIIPSRDPKTNRVTYETFDTLDVTDAKPEEVYACIKEAILRQPAKK